MSETLLRVEDLAKTFVLHNQGGARLPVLEGVSFQVARGEALALTGASGSGKSTLLRILHANYRPSAGRVIVRHRGAAIDMAAAPARLVVDIRRHTIGHVSQFLRVIPRVPTLDVVAEPALARGLGLDAARDKARAILARLNLPERLWPLPPATFSGGEQQRVNIARSLAAPAPLLLLDEPTASLDPENARIVVDIVREAREDGAAVVAIVHDGAVREAIATRSLDVAALKPELAA